MKEIQTNGITILLVEVPEDAIGFIIDYFYLICNPYESDKKVIELPQCQWEILGKSTELSEEQMKEICPKCIGLSVYPDYNFKPTRLVALKFFHTVQESYISLLEANGIVDRCDIEEPEIYHDDGIREPCKYDYPHGFDLEQYHKDLKQWQEAQSKVKHYLVLKMI